MTSRCPADRPAMMHTFFCLPRSIGLFPAFRDGTDRWFSGLRRPVRRLASAAAEGVWS